MATHTLLLVLLLPFLFVAAAAADVAQGPTPPEATNLTRILAKGEQYTTLLRLLNSTGVNEQLASQLKDSHDGLTFFAPTDTAFAKLRAGALNALDDQQQVQLALYHVLPRYYSLAALQTASNPLRTEAYGVVNVTAGAGLNSLVAVSTGVVAVPVSNTLFSEFPLAVYSVDGVLLPEQLFGGSSGKAISEAASSAPAPAPAANKGVAPKKSDAAAEEEDDESTNAAAGSGGVEWSTVAAASALSALMTVVANI